MIRLVKRLLRKILFLFRMFLFDPVKLARKFIAFPIFLLNLARYSRLHPPGSFRVRMRDLYYATYNRFSAAGSVDQHYFHQDIWAARKVHQLDPKDHVDVGSMLNGFVAHVLVTRPVRYVDLRPLSVKIPGLTFVQGNILELPFDDGAVESLSCLHVIEHIGLGRYGDPLDPQGHVVAAKELSRVLRSGGTLILGTPVGREKLCFDAHRIFDPETVINMFSSLELVEFSLIDDHGIEVIESATLEQGRACSFGCGLFVFRKKADTEPNPQAG